MTYIFILDKCILNCKNKRGDCKTTDETPEDVKVMFYCRNTYTTIRKVLKYQRGNQKPYIEEGQTIQWPKKTKKDKKSYKIPKM